MTTRAARMNAEHAGGTLVELAAIGAVVGVALSIVAHLSADVLAVLGVLSVGVSFLFGHIFGRIGAERLGEAAQRGAIAGLATATFVFASGVLFGDQTLMGLVGCAAGALAGALGALLARGTHGF